MFGNLHTKDCGNPGGPLKEKFIGAAEFCVHLPFVARLPSALQRFGVLGFRV